MPAVPSRLREHPLLIAGLWLGVVAAVVAAIAPGRVLVEGPARRGFEVTSIDLPQGILVVFVVLAAVIAAAALLPQLWVRLVGITAVWGIVVTSSLMMIIGRSNDRFASETDLTLRSGGWLLAAALGIALVASVLALIGFRSVAEPPAVPVDELGNALTAPTTSGHATAALVLGICSTLAPLLAVPAGAFGLLGMRQIDLSNGHRTGRGMAVAGLVLGIVWMSIWGLLLGLSVFVVTPTGQ